MVWGISPETPRSGLGALTYAMRHATRVGRPVGGSGAVPDALLKAFLSFGGELRTSSAVSRILCDDVGVRAVVLDDGTEIATGTVVSACDPRRTFVEWLDHPPPQAAGLVRRWSARPHAQGYESKIDAVVSAVPRLRALDDPIYSRLGLDMSVPTTVITPSLAQMDRGARLMAARQILERPGMLVNVPTALDPSMAPPGSHVFSLEAIYTPYDFAGGWNDDTEPKRWLHQFATLVDAGFLESIGPWRVVTPPVYERDFHLPAGHATSFAGGPLAALRNKDPELTKYETAIRGLYLTGAATFPGAGVWGASGRNAATVVLHKLGV